MTKIGILAAAVGAAGLLLDLTDAVPAFSKLPVPPIVWPVVMVAGIVLYIMTRRPAD